MLLFDPVFSITFCFEIQRTSKAIYFFSLKFEVFSVSLCSLTLISRIPLLPFSWKFRFSQEAKWDISSFEALLAVQTAEDVREL